MQDYHGDGIQKKWDNAYTAVSTGISLLPGSADYAKDALKGKHTLAEVYGTLKEKLEVANTAIADVDKQILEHNNTIEQRNREVMQLTMRVSLLEAQAEENAKKLEEKEQTHKQALEEQQKQFEKRLAKQAEEFRKQLEEKDKEIQQKEVENTGLKGTLKTTQEKLKTTEVKLEVVEKGYNELLCKFNENAENVAITLMHLDVSWRDAANTCSAKAYMGEDMQNKALKVIQERIEERYKNKDHMVQHDVKEAIQTMGSNYAANVSGTLKSIMKLVNIFSFDKDLNSIANLLKGVPSINKFYTDLQLQYKTYCKIYDGNEKANIPNHHTIKDFITQYERKNTNDEAVVERRTSIQQKQLTELQKTNGGRFGSTKINFNNATNILKKQAQNNVEAYSVLSGEANGSRTQISNVANVAQNGKPLYAPNVNGQIVQRRVQGKSKGGNQGGVLPIIGRKQP